MGNFLEELPVFDDQPDEARSRAILQFGLGLMQPQNPITGGGPLAAFGNSVQAGLGSLDQDEAKRAAADQQVFQNLISTGKLADSENRTEILGQKADTEQKSKEGDTALGVASLAVQVDEFSSESELRAAKVELDKANAAWLKRRWSGPPNSAGKVTKAITNAMAIDANIEVLYAANKAKYTKADGTRNKDLLYVVAFNAVAKATGLADSDMMALIVNSEKEGEAISDKVSAIMGVPPQPENSTYVQRDPSIPSLTTQEQVDALKPGQQYYWGDGEKYTRR